MSLVLLSQLAGHLINSDMRTPRPTGPMAASTAARVNFPSDFDYTDPQKMFGARGVGALVVDGRGVASGLLHSAEDPKFFILPGRETLLIGRFADPKGAGDAIRRFLEESRLARQARTDGAGGFLAERGAGDLVHARAYNNLFTVWSGPSWDAIEQLQTAARIRAVPAKNRQTQPEWLDDFI
jgi:hypothetical protein